MTTGNTEGKGSSGGKFRPPPATVWNNMVDAGRAWADSQLDSPGGPPTRPRATDIIKIQNTSGAARRTGEILKISGKALDTITAEHVWLLGVEPTADCYFGILKKPVADDGVEQLQVSGCCMALVDIITEGDTHANAIDASYVLESGSSGPLEILYAPAGTGEKECVVRFAGGSGVSVVTSVRFEIVSSDPTTLTGLATLLAWNYGFTQSQIPAAILGNTVIEICDPKGCFLNEPNVDLTGRQGTAVYRQGLPEEVCRPGYAPFDGVWEVETLCCKLISCEVII